jgi:predicted Rossmann fold flavoprotein
LTNVQSQWDVVVIGAGAAGILAAARCAERGRRVLLLEKNRKPGVKVLMSGGTRCNVTHAASRRDIVSAFRDQGPFLHSALAALGPDDVVALMESEGVPTKVEPGGKVFPRSDRALDVLHALRERLNRSGATLSLAEAVLELSPPGTSGFFQLKTTQRTVQAARVIVTTGGCSYPGCGTVGDGYCWAGQLGHTVVPPCPALVPLRTSAEWVRTLPGVTIPDVQVTVSRRGESPPQGKRRSGQGLLQARGSFLFTHVGLSGPAILDVSRAVAQASDPLELLLVCDFLPEMTAEQLTQAWQETARQGGKRQVSSLLVDLLPRRLIEALMHESRVPLDRSLAELSRVERTGLVQMLKAGAVPLNGTLGFEKAEVTAGGVSLSEVDSHTMQSRLVPGLFLAGEVLDLDGPIGGYNFQAAFSTGWLAGQCAAAD